MTAAVPRRGDVSLAQLDKVRPVIILTRDPLAGLLNAVIVAPITSMVRGLSTEAAVGSASIRFTLARAPRNSALQSRAHSNKG